MSPVVANACGPARHSTRLLAGPTSGVDAGIEGGGDFSAPPSFASLRGISLQQNACLGQLPGRVFTGTYQRVEPFRFAQPWRSRLMAATRSSGLSACLCGVAVSPIRWGGAEQPSATGACRYCFP